MQKNLYVCVGVKTLNYQCFVAVVVCIPRDTRGHLTSVDDLA